jgi:hypothetical protein
MRLALRASATAIAVALAILLAGCNDNSTSPTPGVAISALTLTVAPNPITTVQSSAAGPTWAVRYVATLKETNGLGGTIELVTGSLYDESTGVLIARNQFDSADLLVFVGEKRVEANGSLDIPQELTYVATAKRASTVVVTMRFRDDRGNVIEPTLLVKTN